MGIKHDTTHPRGALWGNDHVVAGADEGDVLRYISGEWVPVPSNTVGGSGGVLVLSDTHGSPIVFDDILQTEAMDDFVYADS